MFENDKFIEKYDNLNFKTTKYDKIKDTIEEAIFYQMEQSEGFNKLGLHACDRSQLKYVRVLYHW